MTFAEAGNQGDSGLAAVVYAITNRLADGRWGSSVDAIVNAPGQFEPVMAAGGDWRNLRSVSSVQQARIDTIINLIVEKRLPDLTGGAHFFQNPAVVAQRAALHQVSSGLVDFGGAHPSAVIGAHAFYQERGRGGGSAEAPGVSRRISSAPLLSLSAGDIFVHENRASLVAEDPSMHSRPETDVADSLPEIGPVAGGGSQR